MLADLKQGLINRLNSREGAARDALHHNRNSRGVTALPLLRLGG